MQDCTPSHWQPVAFYDKDRYFAPDIEQAKTLVLSGALLAPWANLRDTWYHHG